MKKYQSNSNGDVFYQEGAFDGDKKYFDKHLSVMGGDGDWKYVCGYKMFVDPDGIIVKGYDPFIGKNFDDIARLDEPVKFNIQLGLQSCTSNLRKSSSEDREGDFAKAMDEIGEYLDAKLEELEMVKSRENKLRVELDPSWAVSSI